MAVEARALFLWRPVSRHRRNIRKPYLQQSILKEKRSRGKGEVVETHTWNGGKSRGTRKANLPHLIGSNRWRFGGCEDPPAFCVALVPNRLKSTPAGSLLAEEQYPTMPKSLFEFWLTVGRGSGSMCGKQTWILKRRGWRVRSRNRAWLRVRVGHGEGKGRSGGFLRRRGVMEESGSGTEETSLSLSESGFLSLEKPFFRLTHCHQSELLI